MDDAQFSYTRAFGLLLVYLPKGDISSQLPLGAAQLPRGKKSEPERLGPQQRHKTDVGTGHKVPHAC